MFLNQRFSDVGKSTEQHLDGLRKMLGVGVDPAYDYSEMEEERRLLRSKPDKKKPTAAGDSTMPPNNQPVPPGANTSGVEQLRKALRELSGSKVQESPEVDATASLRAGHTPIASPAAAASAETPQAQREQRPSPAFMSPTRDHMRNLDVDNPRRFRAPPVGNYSVKDELCQPRVKGSGPGGDFTLQKNVPGRGQADDEIEPVSVELLAQAPERPVRRVPAWDLSKQRPRLDMAASSGIVYNINSSSEGVLDGDLVTSQLARNPSWDFAKLSSAKAKPGESYFQPGQFNVNLSTVRPRTDMKSIGFDRQRPRKPLREIVGRVEIKERAGTHLPDRSLAVSCGLSGTRSMPLLSKEPRVKVYSFDKYSDRPPISEKAPEYHDSSDPVVDGTVLERSLTFDASEADHFIRKRTRDAPDFKKSLKRDQHFKTQKAYGEDKSIQIMRENLKRGPVSVEHLSDIDNQPSLQPRVTHLRDFARMDGREIEKRSTSVPSRSRCQGSPLRFERGIREGDTRCAVGDLSAQAGEISTLRASRSFLPEGTAG